MGCSAVLESAKKLEDRARPKSVEIRSKELEEIEKEQKELQLFYGGKAEAIEKELEEVRLRAKRGRDGEFCQM